MNDASLGLATFTDESGETCVAFIVKIFEDGTVNLHALHPDAPGLRFIQEVPRAVTPNQRYSWSQED
jgi:hypothetical protein